MPDANGHLWEFEQTAWMQDNEKQQFVLAGNGQEIFSPEDSMREIIAVSLGARAHRKGSANLKCSKSHYPPEFSFCPFCGARLSANPHCDSWTPPFGALSGIRMFERKAEILMENIAPARPFPLPGQRGDFQFAVLNLNGNSVLIAINTISGKVSAYNPAKSEWLHLKESRSWFFGENRLPEWSWAAGVITGKHKPGLAVPTAAGPVWIEIDLVKSRMSTTDGPGECLGGVGVYKNRAYVPVAKGPNIAIRCYDPSNGGWDEAVGEISFECPPGGESDRFFGVPVTDEDRHSLFWINAHGLLQCRLTGNSGQDPIAEVAWRPWETDAWPCRALPELGPPFRDRQGQYWQLCFDEKDNGFRYYKLTGDESDVVHVDGGRFSSGAASFHRYYDFWNEPWEDRDDRVDDRASSFRAPLLTIANDLMATVMACFGEGATETILSVIRNSGKRYNITFRIESPHAPMAHLPLEHAILCSKPWLLRVFVYRDELVVYVPEEGTAWAWKLW